MKRPRQYCKSGIVVGMTCCLVWLGLRGGVVLQSRAATVQREAAEVGQILDNLERLCDEGERTLKGGNEQAIADAYAKVSKGRQLLDFVEREATATLARNEDLRERLQKLKTRLDGLLKALSQKLPRLEEPLESAALYSMKAAPRRGLAAARVAPASPAMVMSPAGGMAPHPKHIIRPPKPLPEEWNREAYEHQDENPFVAVKDDPLSTFSIDVDTASYSNLRRMIMREERKEIPRGAIRIEEMVNYFKYSYRQPGEEHPLAVDVEATSCPWAPDHRLARVVLQARKIDAAARKPSNLVFLIDSSGSMRSEDKIGLLKQAYGLLVDGLDDRDRVAIVTYAGSAGLVLPSTTANNRLTLKFAVEKLEAGGSTAGGAGIRLAYKTARENFIKGGNNRVILATDGDFNVGVSSQSDLVDLIREEAKSGVFLTVLGFGTGNYQDARMEALSNHGNGNYAYIDDMAEARKVFLSDLMSTLYTVCKDVKFQIEFNPAYVQSYRLIGYENRQLADRDFKDDKKDAGEVGSGHQVTAIYELVPVGAGGGEQPVTGDLRYQGQRAVVEKAELMQIKVRYKQPDGDTSTEMVHQVPLPAGWAEGPDFAQATEDTRFAAAVAGFGMILRGSEHKGTVDMDWVHRTAVQALGQDSGGYRSGFVGLVAKARDIQARPEVKPVPPPQPEPRPVPVPQ